MFIPILIMTNGFSAATQQTAVSGTVTIQKGDNLLGITVNIQGTTICTVADLNENFNLSSDPVNAMLLFSCSGMETKQ